MTSDARQNGGKTKQLTPNIVSAHNQWYSKDYVIWLVLNEVERYGVTLIPACLSGMGRHFKRSVDTLIVVLYQGALARLTDHGDVTLSLCKKTPTC